MLSIRISVQLYVSAIERLSVIFQDLYYTTDSHHQHVYIITDKTSACSTNF